MEAPCKARLHGDGGTTLCACWEGTASRPWGACAPGSLPSAGLMTSPWGHPLPLLCFLAGDSHPHPLWGLIPTPPLDPDSGCSLSGVEAQLTRRKAWVKADCQASVKAPACLAQAFPVAKLISCSLRALFLKFLFIYLFIGCTGSSLLCVLSLIAASAGYSLAVCGLLIAVTSLVLQHKF